MQTLRNTGSKRSRVVRLETRFKAVTHDVVGLGSFGACWRAVTSQANTNIPVYRALVLAVVVRAFQPLPLMFVALPPRSASTSSDAASGSSSFSASCSRLVT